MIELLLSCERIEVNQVSPIHGTPLHLACQTDQIKIV